MDEQVLWISFSTSIPPFAVSVTYTSFFLLDAAQGREGREDKPSVRSRKVYKHALPIALPAKTAETSCGHSGDLFISASILPFRGKKGNRADPFIYTPWKLYSMGNLALGGQKFHSRTSKFLCDMLRRWWWLVIQNNFTGSDDRFLGLIPDFPRLVEWRRISGYLRTATRARALFVWEKPWLFFMAMPTMGFCLEH